MAPCRRARRVGDCRPVRQDGPRTRPRDHGLSGDDRETWILGATGGSRHSTTVPFFTPAFVVAALQGQRPEFLLELDEVKPWGQTGEKCFNVGKGMWELFQSLGADLYAIAMDEPLLCCRHHIKKSDDHAVQETAKYIALVRRRFPQLLIGDIETYPSIPVDDHIWWIETLHKKLAELGVRGLDFCRCFVKPLPHKP